MATFRRFEEIVAWQRAKRLAHEVYRATESGPIARDFALRDQIRRAAISAMSNIAEGFERDGRKEFLQFLSIAKGSVGELRSHLYLAGELRLVSAGDFRRLFELAQETSRTVAGLMKYLRSSPTRGKKFQTNFKLET